MAKPHSENNVTYAKTAAASSSANTPTWDASKQYGTWSGSGANLIIWGGPVLVDTSVDETAKKPLAGQ
jgi:hypothetical protein